MNINRNVGTADRIIRIVVGVALIALTLTTQVAAPFLYVLWLVAALALVTGAVGFCPAYAVLRLSTARSSR